MKFSQRTGKTPSTKPIQIESMDQNLRNSLWNGLQIHFLDVIQYETSKFNQVCKVLWLDFFIKPIDTIPAVKQYKLDELKKWFFKAEWYEVYDLMEFMSNTDFNALYIAISFKIDEYINFCNNIFEREFAGYRFVNNKISPITNDLEISEIETAISASFTPAAGANIHLTNALDKLSDKVNPDYRNSIKESISAVESVAKSISKGSNDSLGGALDKIKGKIKMHQALERGFKQLYGYTSDAGGIRHALMDNTTACDFEDAKYMLVSCSAFINYLLAKAQKANI